MRLSKELRYITGISLASLMLFSFGGTAVANADTTASTTTHIELTPQLLKAYEQLMGKHYHLSPSLIRKINEHNFNVMHQSQRKQLAHALTEYKRLASRYGKDLAIVDAPKVDKSMLTDRQADMKKIKPEMLKDESIVDTMSERPNEVRHERKMSVTATINQYQHQILNDINYDREEHGLSPVKESKDMNKLAGIRSDQLETNYSHFNKNHQSLAVLDAKQAHINWSPGLGENIDQRIYGDDWEVTGELFQPKNGSQMANETEDLMMYHDNFVDRDPESAQQGYHENNGHRANILNPDAISVGISVSYDAKTKTYSIAEEFHYGNSAQHYHGKNQYKNYIHDLG